MDKRRDFLKLFGVGTAIVASATGEPEGLIIPDAGKPPAVVPPRMLNGEAAVERLRRSTLVKDGLLYDALSIPKWGLSSVHNFFFDATPRPYTETNMSQPGWLSQPEHFLVKQIGLTFQPDSKGEISANDLIVIRNYAMHLWVGQRQFALVPLVDCFTAPQDGRTGNRGLYTLDIPILLEPGYQFHVTLTGTPFRNPRPVVMWAKLRGQQLLGIQ